MDEQDPEILMRGEPRGGEAIEQPAKLIRIARRPRSRPRRKDEAGRKRLRQIYDRALAALREGLSGDLQQELDTLTIPLEGTPSQSEIRIAQAQLVGWLEGLFHGIQAALWAQHMQAGSQLAEMRRRGLPPGSPDSDQTKRPGQYL